MRRKGASVHTFKGSGCDAIVSGCAVAVAGVGGIVCSDSTEAYRTVCAEVTALISERHIFC